MSKNETNAPICMTQEFWMNGYLSVARYHGGVRFQRHQYVIVDKLGRDLWECTFAADRAGSSKAIPPGEPADLVRMDFVKHYKALGRDKFLQMLKDNQHATDKELKARMKELADKAKAEKKQKKESKQLSLFEEGGKG